MRPPRALNVARLVAVVVGMLWASSLDARDAEEPRPAASRPEGEKKDEGPAEEPGLLDPIFGTVDPARLHRGLDRWLGIDSGEVSDRPRAPEIGEPVFFDLVRPLGDRKYANELNHLYNSSTRTAPGLQVIEYEYVFADWRSAELDLSYFNGNLQILTPFYQRTIGVGPKGNWVHGYQLSLDLYLRSGFVGGSPAYVFSWKPEEKSKFSSTFFVGANRALIGGFNPARFGMPIPNETAGGPPDRVFGAWRPMFAADFFYEIDEHWSVGIENDFFFQSGEAAEYLSLPFVTYKSGEHAFFQVGGGYYRFESRDQFTFMAHINLVNLSDRRPREAERPPRESDPERPEEGGRLRRWFGRLLGDH